MPQLCLYFQLHQPYRLSDYSVFDIDNHSSYFDDDHQSNRQIFTKVANKSYLPMLSLLLDLTQRHPEFKFAISASGVFIEQAQEYQPAIIELLQQLAQTGQVEFLAETYHHSLALLYSQREFVHQVQRHHQLMTDLFGTPPTVFRNTELIYWNHLAEVVHELGYHGVLTEAVPRYLGDRPKTQVYRSHSEPTLPLLLKHAELSDDIAFRFSDRNWPEWPLTAERYVRWLHDYYAEEVINLFMDFETFGEHQWEDTGIFDFFQAVIADIDHSPVSHFVTPSDMLLPYRAQHQHRGQQTSQKLHRLPVYDVPEPISWADIDRDLTAWRDNELQHDTLRLVYELEEVMMQTQDQQLVEDWRRLQTSDHFYYMCTKWSADGDVHAYFSPYESPYEAYRRYSTVLADLKGRVGKKVQ